MNSFGFEMAHGYQILKGYVTAENIREEWDDIIDEFDSETLTEGYEIIDIWS